MTMKVSTVRYEGALRTKALHLPSGTIIHTDAPVDNQGLGTSFSPTDLTATALASCMFTIMGIKARDKGWDLTGMTAEVTKIMAADPRRIAGIVLDVQMPEGVWSEASRLILERAAKTCPVALSLHPEIAVDLNLHWPAPVADPNG
ncbi:MAG: OsmC family peroxiredoxin [Bacteroidetes bacterium]|nr:OsmC family peroxiredoxin [Bacteroidota bacterium]